MITPPSSLAPSRPTASAPRGFRGIRVGAALVALAAPWIECAAQTATGAVVRSDFMHVFDRLDAVGVTLLVGAVVIIVLLVLRIWTMARNERPKKGSKKKGAKGASRKQPARKSAARRLEPLERTTLGGTTDWGFDQNKRSSSSRQMSEAKATSTLPSLDLASTQWSNSEVINATQISLQPNESMGKSPNAAASPYRTAFNPYFKGDSPIPDVEVIEVADTLLQAELLVQLGDPKQAMTLLSNHIRETEKPGPAVWLMLLNLYQTTGRKSQYEALATGFGTLFNAAVPQWATSKEVAARDIESYPQVMMKLHTNWGKPAVRPMLESLLNDDRGGSRQGFSLKAYRDLLFLVEIVAELDKMATEDAERDDIQRKLGRNG